MVKLFFSISFLGLLAQHVSAQSCFKDGVGYSGDYPRKVRAFDAFDCQTACLYHSSCVVWSYDGDGRCYLFPDGATASNRPGIISGPKKCRNGGDQECELNDVGCQGMDDGSLCFLKGIQLQGSKVSSSQSRSVSSCHHRCVDDSKCLYFTYDSDHKVCSLLNDDNFSIRRDQKSYSGPRSCSPPVSPNSQVADNRCFLLDVAIQGKVRRAYTKDKSPSIADCQSRCSSDSNCRYWTYSDLGCLLQDREGYKHVTYQRGSVAGPKGCDSKSLRRMESELNDTSDDSFDHDIFGDTSDSHDHTDTSYD